MIYQLLGGAGVEAQGADSRPGPCGRRAPCTRPAEIWEEAQLRGGPDGASGGGAKGRGGPDRTLWGRG